MKILRCQQREREDSAANKPTCQSVVVSKNGLATQLHARVHAALLSAILFVAVFAVVTHLGSQFGSKAVK